MPQTARPKTAGRITQDDIEANFIRIQKAHEETERTLRESMEDTRKLKESTEAFKKSTETFKDSTEAFKKSLRESMEETDRKLKESIEGTDRKLRESMEETDRRLKESLRESIEETNRKLNESIDKTSKKIFRSIGGITNTIGKISENMLIPNLVEKFKQLGFTFDVINRRRKIVDGEHGIRTEIDAFLENRSQAMAVEVKTTLRRDEVDWHVERMEKIRRHADLHNDRRRFYGAIAASVIDDDTKLYALNQGFYIIEPSGEDVRIVAPGAVKSW